MNAYKNYKHIVKNNIFGIRDKINNFKKPNSHANKNRQVQNRF